MPTAVPFRIVPLGGLGEVGGNAMLYQCPDGAVLVDCGLLFPSQDEPGVDYLVPRFDYLRELDMPLQAVVLTHAHEDHIGALPALLSEFPLPVYASRITHAFLASRLRSLEQPVRQECVEDGESRDIGPFTFTFVPVTHSVPGAFVLLVDTPIGTVVHTGDYKLDPTPLDDRITRLDMLDGAHERGVALLLSDSTNALYEGRSGSEIDVAAGLEKIISQASRRVVVTTFASHLHRIKSVIAASRKCGRKLMFVGRAVQESLQIGISHNILDIEPEMLVDQAEYEWVRPDRLTVIASGSQGEPTSAMTRIALGNHGDVQLESGDTVIFSARRIPGNETAVARVHNALVRRGARVLTDQLPDVHVSGHCCRDEQREMLQTVQPEVFCPIHGEHRHLYAHAALARQIGMDDSAIHVIEDGIPLELERRDGQVSARYGKPVPHGYLCVDGKGIGDVAEHVLRDRRELANRGIVLCSLVFNHHHHLAVPPHIDARGVIYVDGHPELIQGAMDEIRIAIEKSPTLSRADDDYIRDTARRALRRFWKRELGRNPLVLTAIHRLDRR